MMVEGIDVYNFAGRLHLVDPCLQLGGNSFDILHNSALICANIANVRELFPEI